MLKKFLIFGGGAALLLALALGLTDINTLTRPFRYAYYSIVGQAQAVGARGAAQGGGLPAARTCRENLQRIQAGKRKAGDIRGNNIGNVTWEEVISAMYPNDRTLRGNTKRINELMPKCPAGGTYTLDTMQSLPRCSIGGQNTATVEDDHVITR